MRTAHTIFYMERHLFFTCARGHVPQDSQGKTQVKLFLELKGYFPTNLVYPLTLRVTGIKIYIHLKKYLGEEVCINFYYIYLPDK